MTTTREHRLLELVEKWRSVGPDEEPEYRRPDGVSVYCADELAAILAEPVEVSEEMVCRYVDAVNEHLGSLTEKDWEIERFDPKASIARVARIGLTAALKEPGQ